MNSSSDPVACTSAAQSVGMGDKLASLLRVESYPDESRWIEAIETHFAWVFLTETRAYKMKKAVRAPGFDHTELEARHQNCLAELRLNRRLAPDVYLDVIPLTQEPDGSLRLDGCGRAIEWLVAMRRLPRELMLDAAIAAGTATKERVHRAALLLSDFYVSQASAELDSDAYRARMVGQVEQNVLALASKSLGLSEDLIGALAHHQRELLVFLSEEIKARARCGRVIEGHGDLRPEHIFLGSPACVIDCLEFSFDLRLFDPFEELAFLTIECAQAGAEPIADQIIETYRMQTGDSISSRLLSFYKSHRAATRAKIIAWHLLDENLREQAAWAAIADGYIGVAVQHAQRALAST